MSVSIPRLSASARSEDLAAGLHEHGAVIVEGVLDPDLLARFNTELDPLLPFAYVQLFEWKPADVVANLSD